MGRKSSRLDWRLLILCRLGCLHSLAVYHGVGVCMADIHG